MKRILYLHGLESDQGGPKVDFLTRVSLVHAPAMNYKTHDWTIDELVDLVEEYNPDLIIGSSMGGYFADVIGSHTGIEVLLFNPAIHSRSIDINLPYGEKNWKRHFVVGEDDTVVDSKLTEVLADISESFDIIKGMGHRTDLNTFKAIYLKYFG